MLRKESQYMEAKAHMTTAITSGLTILTGASIAVSGFGLGQAISESTMWQRRGDFGPLACVCSVVYSVAGIAATVFLNAMVCVIGDATSVSFGASLMGSAFWITAVALGVLTLNAFQKACQIEERFA